MAKSNQRFKYSLIISIVAGLFFIPFLGGVHLFDWDEINFAEISREMIILEDYLRIYVNFEPFWEKPPLFFWLQVVAMKTFGINEFSARLPNAICGIATLVILFNIGKSLYNTRFGLLWVGAYFGSVLPFMYFKSGIIDPWFNLFIFLGLYLLILFYWKHRNFNAISSSKNPIWYLLLGGFIVGLGVLTKGPVAYLIAALSIGVYWVFRRFRFYIGLHHFIYFSLAASVVTLAWYGLETLKNGPWFIREFNLYQIRLLTTPDAGHKGFPGYHVIVLLLGCFPASVFALRSFFKAPGHDELDYQRDFRLWMKILFWVVLALFSIVESKIVHYSSMCYFPLTFLAAWVIEKQFQNQLSLKKWVLVTLSIIAGIYILVIIAFPILALNLDAIIPLINDPFAVANLQANVHWTGFEVMPGLLLLAIIIYFLVQNKKGQLRQAYVALFGGTAVFTMLTLIFFIARVEGYSQNAAVEFMEEHADEDAYIIPAGYKTYTHLFYGKAEPRENPALQTKEWMLTSEEVKKDVYVITKVDKLHVMEPFDKLEKIGEKNGFVFFKREVE